VANAQLPRLVASAFLTTGALAKVVRRKLSIAIVVLALPAVALAQFGHPLKGQWSGEWGPKNNPSRLLLDIEWDGKDLTGRINPGTETAGIVKKVTIDYSAVTSWKVQIEGEVNEGGKVVPVRVDGTLENLGAYTKAFHGTWTQGGRKGEFAVTRN
jgi:hypothetical protein